MSKYKEMKERMLKDEEYKNIKYIIKMDFGYEDYYFAGDGYVSQMEEPEGTILFVSKNHNISINQLIDFSVYVLGIHPYKTQDFKKIKDTFFEDYVSDEELQSDFHSSSLMEDYYKNSLDRRKSYTSIVVLDLDGENILYNKLEYEDGKEVIQKWIDENLDIGYKAVEERYIR